MYKETPALLDKNEKSYLFETLTSRLYALEKIWFNTPDKELADKVKDEIKYLVDVRNKLKE